MIRSRDCASAGDWGSVLAMLEARLVAMLLVILILTGESALTALRVVALGLSPTLGRLRLRMGEGCWVVVYC